MNTKSFIKFKSNFFHEIEHISYFWNSNIVFNNTPLICAVDKGHFEIVELLLSKEGIEINRENI